jgi:hypothetical protein
VVNRDYVSACSVLSDLIALARRSDISSSRKSGIEYIIAKRGERRKIKQIESDLIGLDDAEMEEVFAYLAMMPPVSVGPLCEMLAESEVRKIRYLLCRAISIVARNEPERLRPYLGDARWFVVRNMVMIAGMMGSPETIPLLRQTASATEPRVRRELARSLGKIGNPDGLDILEQLVEDDNKMVRLAALAAIREIGSTEAAAVLAPLVREKNFRQKPSDEKREFMRTYGSLGKASLRHILAIAEGREKGMDEKSRAYAAYGLAMIDDHEALDFLARAVDQESGVLRHAASEALAIFKDRKEREADHGA